MTDERALPTRRPLTPAGGSAVELPRQHRVNWELFVDWCTAFGWRPLPASPVTVAGFLTRELPDASRSALRRRVTAINLMHTLNGYDRPGSATAVRRLLTQRKSRAADAAERIRILPTTGWPAGLFGRRDALVLWLVCRVGIPSNHIGELRCADLSMPRTNIIRIDAGHDIEIPVDPDDPFGLLPVWKRWVRVRNILAQRPGPAPLVRPLTEANPVDRHSKPSLAPPPLPVRPSYALLPAFDQWGNLVSAPGRDTEGVSGKAAATIVRDHLGGKGRRVPDRERWVQGVIARTEMPAVPEPAAGIDIHLPDHHADGLAAKRRAAAVFDGIEDNFADIDRMTADLLARTEQILADIESRGE